MPINLPWTSLQNGNGQNLYIPTDGDIVKSGNIDLLGDLNMPEPDSAINIGSVGVSSSVSKLDQVGLLVDGFTSRAEVLKDGLVVSNFSNVELDVKIDNSNNALIEAISAPLVLQSESVNLSHNAGNCELSVGVDNITALTAKLNLKAPSNNDNTFLSIQNGDSSNVKAEWRQWVAGNNGGGLAAGHLELWKYLPSESPVKVVDYDTTGNISMPAGITSLKEVRITNAPAFSVGSNFDQRGTQLTRPMFLTAGSNEVQRSSSPLIRFFDINTPSDTGVPVRVQDPFGTYYNVNDWTVCVVGFQNVGGDRTYNCFCFFDVNRDWYVQYDNAGSGGTVKLMAISNALYVGGSI